MQMVLRRDSLVQSHKEIRIHSLKIRLLVQQKTGQERDAVEKENSSWLQNLLNFPLQNVFNNALKLNHFLKILLFSSKRRTIIFIFPL